MLKTRKKVSLRVLVFLVLSSILACVVDEESMNMVPREVSSSPNYWCTWYWQNYLILKGQDVLKADAKTIYSNQAAREEMNEETIFGNDGMANVILTKTRGDYYFVIDHGWQDKSIKENTFFTLIMDTLDFPRYADLKPKERIKQMNSDIKALGWKGLGLWVRGNPSQEEMKKFVEWSQYAEIEYWKIDGGDTQFYYASQYKNELYPQLKLEHITGAGPINPKWDIPGLKLYPSIYNGQEAASQKLEATLNAASEKVERSLDVIKNTDVFRTYDAAPLLVSTTTLQRVSDILVQTAGKSEYKAFLNVQDDCNIAAALGLVVAAKRHPMKTPRNYKGRDLHFQIAGDRHVDQRLNEMDRFVLWQRLAPPMSSGYGTYDQSAHNLIDSIVFQESDTWYKASYGKMVRQSAPAIVARNIALPKVEKEGLAPYVMASKFPNGAVAIATEGRVQPDKSWILPRANITLREAELNEPIGVFGHYESLTLEFDQNIPEDARIYAQDMLAKEAIEITGDILTNDNRITISGALIDKIGTMENDENDISAPGLVIKVISTYK
jgi:hypothetical protein